MQFIELIDSDITIGRYPFDPRLNLLVSRLLPPFLSCFLSLSFPLLLFPLAFRPLCPSAYIVNRVIFSVVPLSPVFYGVCVFGARREQSYLLCCSAVTRVYLTCSLTCVEWSAVFSDTFPYELFFFHLYCSIMS